MEPQSIELLVKNEPPSYKFKIGGLEVNFEKYRFHPNRDDDLAWAFAKVAWSRRGVIKAATVKSHISAIDRFYEYLSKEVGIIKLIELNQSLINNFIYWLKFNAPVRLARNASLSESTKRKNWGYIREYLKDIIDSNQIPSDIELPTHIFDANISIPFKPYSKEELKKIIQACIQDSKDVLRGYSIVDERGGYTPYLAKLIPHAILVSIRTGINPEVLFDIEITKNSIKSSHILNSSRLILPIKKRANKSQNIELLEDIVDGVRVKNNVVRLLEEVELLTKIPRKMLPIDSPLRNKLWLVKDDNEKVDVFNNFSYYMSLQSFAKRHNIKSSSGEIIEINFKRFRPTFAEAILKINGGDVRDLQKRLGHSYLRTTMGYLDPNLEERKNAFQFAGKAMVEWALQGKEKPTKEKIAEVLGISLENAEKFANGDFNMGVAKCKDPFASPLKEIKKGELCTEYLACFRCGNCVVMKDDSHRLFSFYNWLKSKREVIGQEKWQATYGWIIEIIDKDIAPKLGNEEWVESSIIKAIRNPFPMWKIEA